MSAPNWYPPIDDSLPEELQRHLRLVYDRLQNHATAVANQQAQIKQLQSQVAALQSK